MEILRNKMKPLLEYCKKHNVSPEFLMILRLTVAIITGIVLFSGNYLLSAIFITLCQFTFLLDYIDGPLARYQKCFSIKLNIIDRKYHYIIPALFLAAITCVSFFKYNNLIATVFGCLGIVSILLTLFIESKYLNAESFNKIKHLKTKYQGLHTFFGIDLPFSLFFILIITNQIVFATIFFGVLRTLMFIRRRIMLWMMNDHVIDDEEITLQKRRAAAEEAKVKENLATRYSGDEAKNYEAVRSSDIRMGHLLDREEQIIKDFLWDSKRGNLLEIGRAHV